MKRKFFITVTLAMGLISSIAQVNGPEIKFDNIEHNYGKIREDGGKANHTFYFTNTGNDTLHLKKVQPTCGCTASDWTKTPVLPGQQGMVTAVYDPIGRPGPFKKSILVQSNAKSSPNMSLFISGEVIPRQKTYADTFRVHLGDLLFDRNNPAFMNLQYNEVRRDTIRFYNNSDKEMQISLKESPTHIGASLSVQKLKPQQRGFLVLTYDAGKMTTPGNRNDRVVLQTNDPKQEVKMLFVTSSVIAKPQDPTPEQLYPFQMGNLRMVRNSVSFPDILNTAKKTDSMTLYNNGTYPVNIAFKEVPKHISAALSSPVIEPGKTVALRITYDASKTNQFGFVTNDRIMMQTNDTLQPLKVLYVSANIKEDFSKLTPQQKENAPKIVFENNVFDFGTKPSGPDVPHSFVFSNTGKSDLIIRSVRAGCGCTATHSEKTVIKPGEKSKIDMVFNTKNRVGNQYKSITVVTNDPENSVIMLQVKGNLEKAE